MNFQSHLSTAAGWLASLALILGAVPVLADDSTVVTYEAFGAVGDGVADDLPAICKAHEHANKNGLRVRSNPAATYHLGRQAQTALVQTDTDWGTSKFVIDDSRGVENHKRPLFEVRSRLSPVPLKIDRLVRGQKRLNVQPPADCLVYVENKNRKMFIRRGLNRNDGVAQQEVFVVRRDGSIEGGIDWDYEVVTRVMAYLIDPEPLQLRGGIFTHIANRIEGSSYWDRGISIRRSNTVVDGVTHRVKGETAVGSPYSGFLRAGHSYNITFRNCLIDGRKTYQKIGAAGKTVAMGSYGYHASQVVNFRMSHCRMEDIHDSTRWGVAATNFMKNILVEDCELSRMDVHMGVSGVYIIRRTTLGHAGLNAIGRGRLTIEDSTLHGRNLIYFRDDYGATWDGEVLIRNSRWIPRSGNPVMFGVNNDGTHDFGYACSMPRSIRIDGLTVDDSKVSNDRGSLTIFSDPTGKASKDRPFPYRLTERLEIRNLRVASGLKPVICSNPEVAKAIKVSGG
jgi:hypothetical protein